MERRGPAFDDFRPDSKSQWGNILNVFTSEERLGALPSAFHHKNPPGKLFQNDDILSFIGDTDLWAFEKKIREEQEKEFMDIAIGLPYRNLSLTNLCDLSATN